MQTIIWHSKIFKRKFIALSCLLAAACLVTTTYAQTTVDEEDEDSGKSWQELAVVLPAAPLTDNLIKFEVSASTTQTFAIDEKSLSVGDDGVIRYTVVSASPLGAKNVQYEGIRCTSSEHKLYATGRADGSWVKARRSEWQPISGNNANRVQAALARDYFCAGSSIAGKDRDMLRRLRRHDVLSSEFTRGS